MDKELKIDFAQYNRPFLGERLSGDLPVIHDASNHVYFVLIDGLGHGEEASAMSAQISKELNRCWSLDPATIIADLNQRLTAGVGAAIGVLIVNKEKLTYRYSGLGNIKCKIIHESNHTNLTSTDGILGMRYRTTKTISGEFKAETLVLMSSDGVSGLDSIENWNKLKRLTSTTITRRIVGNYGTDLDDSSCVAVKIN
jgi:hypothetical protein